MSERGKHLYWYRIKIDPAYDPPVEPIAQRKPFNMDTDLRGNKPLARTIAIDFAKRNGIKHCVVSFVQIFPDTERREPDYDSKEIRALEIKGSQAWTIDRALGVKRQAVFFPMLYKHEHDSIL